MFCHPLVDNQRDVTRLNRGPLTYTCTTRGIHCPMPATLGVQQPLNFKPTRSLLEAAFSTLFLWLHNFITSWRHASLIPGSAHHDFGGPLCVIRLISPWLEHPFVVHPILILLFEELTSIKRRLTHSIARNQLIPEMAARVRSLPYQRNAIFRARGSCNFPLS
ncbi:hypothetical protein B0F90DRAFT_1344423 [Multifurca ochricompacta]|uniref:Uncharacterized protein n=1 Tax=Multifurca ochricompacta TaxID=376703 RepID=A0AAD4LXE9_9AGAM|nr:hypothetical protein B0F90DRAFT_1344423 [Multifurca ochricompacta]